MYTCSRELESILKKSVKLVVTVLDYCKVVLNLHYSSKKTLQKIESWCLPFAHMVKINFYFANIHVSLLKLAYTQTGFSDQSHNQLN